VIGYTIKFEKSGEINVYNGADGVSPVLGIKEFEGRWYWTLNGEWLKDNAGNKLAVEGVTPTMKIEEGRWLVSYDNGKSWKDCGPAVADKFLFKEIKVGEEDVQFILADGTVITMPLNTSEKLNLPFGIIVIDTELPEMHLGELASFYILVNPSNFELDPNQLGIMASHNIFTCYTDKAAEIPSEAVFDENAKCEFKPVGIEAVEGIPGGYNVYVVAEGEGNLYDFASFYLYAKNDDSKGDEKRVYSNDPLSVTVIPTIGQGIFVDTPMQSFLKPDKNGLVKDTLIKPFCIGLWSNFYVNKNRKIIFYDKEKVTVEGISLEGQSRIDTSFFKTNSIVRLNPFENSDLWKGCVDSMNVFVEEFTVPDMKITLHRDGAKPEDAELPFTYSYRLQTNKIVEEEVSYSKTDDPFHYDQTGFRDKSGILKFQKPRYFFPGSGENEMNASFMGTIDPKEEKFEYDVMVYAKPGNECYASYQSLYTLMGGQGPNGGYAEPKEIEDFLLFNFNVTHIYTVTE